LTVGPSAGAGDAVAGSAFCAWASAAAPSNVKAIAATLRAKRGVDMKTPKLLLNKPF
jgi:hypothetical protein